MATAVVTPYSVVTKALALNFACMLQALSYRNSALQSRTYSLRSFSKFKLVLRFVQAALD